MKEIMCDICGAIYKDEEEQDCNVCNNCIQHYNDKALKQDKNYQILSNEGI